MLSYIITALLVASALAIVVAVVELLLRKKGARAERRVHSKLASLPPEYMVFDNVLFQSNDRSVQIDHIVVSPYGIFVVETKGYHGYIYGSENVDYWTQSLSGVKTQFYSPVLQNIGHVRFLAYLLKEIGHPPIVPIVVFDNEATLSIHAEFNIIINRRELRRTIRRYRKVVITPEQIDFIVHAIEANRREGRGAARAHKRYARMRQREAQQRRDMGLCPRCGGRLVERNGRYGAFLGCQNFPQCRYVGRLD